MKLNFFLIVFNVTFVFFWIGLFAIHFSDSSQWIDIGLAIIPVLMFLSIRDYSIRVNRGGIEFKRDIEKLEKSNEEIKDKLVKLESNIKQEINIYSYPADYQQLKSQKNK